VGASWLKGALGDFFATNFERKMEATREQLCSRTSMIAGFSAISPTMSGAGEPMGEPESAC
jgi:hypothetical protein